jgi:hypothetical protein
MATLNPKSEKMFVNMPPNKNPYSKCGQKRIV